VPSGGRIIIVKSQNVTSRKESNMAETKTKSEIAPITIQPRDIKDLIYTWKEKEK
jgi:hypothetical protein